MPLSICVFCQNWSWMELHLHLYWQPSQYALHPHCYTCIPDFADAWQHFICTCMTVTVIVSMGNFLPLCVPNNLTTFATLSHPGILWVMNKNSRQLTMQKTSKEFCIQYNYTRCIWAIFWDQMKWTTITGKRCTWEWHTEVSPCVHVCVRAHVRAHACMHTHLHVDTL
jgi:hypothetical protein